jgi:UDP-N-acetyl-D-mannosaminuronate dehydrogenase
MYSDDEIRALGFEPYAIGSPADGVVLQADHKEYKTLRENDFPSVRTVVDGRRTMDQQNFPNVIFRVIGAGQDRIS